MSLWNFCKSCYLSFESGRKRFFSYCEKEAFLVYYDKMMDGLLVNKQILTKEQKKEIKNFYSSYHKVGTVEHAFFTEKTGIFSAQYIPTGLYMAFVDSYFNDWDSAKVIDNKCFYGKLIRGIAQPKVLCYRESGLWFDGNGQLQNKEKCLTALIQQKSSFFIKKATNSFGGKGVSFVNIDTADVQAIESIINPIEGDIVIQQAVCQSSLMAEFNSSSVNTIRVLSLLRKDGTVKIYSRCLRMGIGGSKVDNDNSGGISCGIHADGQLNNRAFSKNGNVHYEHPTTHVKFGDYIIPNIPQIDELVKQMHLQVPHFRLVSWDIALGENNEPVLIEVNLSQGGLILHQLNNGPVFGEDTKQILDEVFGK